MFDEILGGFNVEIEYFISREAKCFGKKDLILYFFLQITFLMLVDGCRDFDYLQMEANLN
jgi:hypothetical protein